MRSIHIASYNNLKTKPLLPYKQTISIDAAKVEVPFQL